MIVVEGVRVRCSPVNVPWYLIQEDHRGQELVRFRRIPRRPLAASVVLRDDLFKIFFICVFKKNKADAQFKSRFALLESK